MSEPVEKRPEDRATPGSAEPPDPRVVVEWMASRNPVFRVLNCEILLAERGRTRLAMPISADHANTFGVMHGGMLFAFADLCFGFTGNGARNIMGVSASADIHWLAPGPIGARLIGEATEVWREGRNGLYDVKLWNDDTGDVIAIVHGRMRFVGGPVMAEDPTPNNDAQS